LQWKCGWSEAEAVLEWKAREKLVQAVWFRFKKNCFFNKKRFKFAIKSKNDDIWGMTVANSNTKMGLIDISQLDFNERYTYEEYNSWKFTERIELIDGAPYQVMSAPKIIHQRVSMRLSAMWFNFLFDKNCEVFAAPVDVYFLNPKGGKINTVVQPDLCIVCIASKIEEKGIKGAPDLVIEILSPNNKRDLTEKYSLYEREGVKEYWIVNPNEKWLVIYTLDSNANYIGSKHYTPEDVKVSSILFPAFEVDLKKLFDIETVNQDQ